MVLSLCPRNGATIERCVYCSRCANDEDRTRRTSRISQSPDKQKKRKEKNLPFHALKAYRRTRGHLNLGIHRISMRTLIKQEFKFWPQALLKSTRAAIFSWCLKNKKNNFEKIDNLISYRSSARYFFRYDTITRLLGWRIKYIFFFIFRLLNKYFVRLRKTKEKQRKSIRKSIRFRNTTFRFSIIPLHVLFSNLVSK
jgi:hypothetical protein